MTKPVLSEGEKILEAIRKKQRLELVARARADRDKRTDAEIVAAYHEHMAQQRKANG